MRRPNSALILILGFGLAVVLAALAGLEAAPGAELLDTRRSTYLTGPGGTSGFAAALEELGVTVERRQRGLFGFAADTATIDTGAWLALLDLTHAPSDVEARELVKYVQRGGALLVAARGSRVLEGVPLLGGAGVEQCFGYRVDRAPGSRGHWLTVVPPIGSVTLAETRLILRRGRRVSDVADRSELPACEAGQPNDIDVLLRGSGGQVVAVRLSFESGGRVILLADSRYVSNRDLKETDAGLVVLPWILRESPSRVMFDEYHHGFGHGGSIFAAAWRWARATPGGWAMLQLALVALIAVGVAAVRFGPALSVVERRRRSPLEHLDALAIGLERSEGRDIAVRLITSGLRRRLSRSGHAIRSVSGDMTQWLGSLELAAHTPEARVALRRLGSILRIRGGEEQVLDAATVVEDVWEALRPTRTRKPS